MADVAAVAGVSHQTVSRVLNGTGIVRPETRDRVLKVIAEMGYRRNETARALATSRSRLLGIITPSFGNYGPATTLLSVQQAANEKGYIVSVATMAEFTAANLRHALNQFLGQGVAGIIVIVPVEEMARELENFPIPVPTLAVASSWVTDDSSIPRVGVDQRGGVLAAMRHLRGKGRTQVAHLAGPGGWFDAMEREIAWREFLDELQMTAGPRLQGDWSAASGYEMAKELIKGELPEAIFVANDQMSLGALRAFHEAGVAIPEDTCLIGYDDEEGVDFFIPSLTTVRQDFHALGYEAIASLTGFIDGEKVQNKLIPVQLQVRVSA